jgi:exonuclease SbcC
LIIKELEVRNVRSYGHALVRFPLGKTLFEGDIGSGKSSILMAIEFALFGLGSETGTSLLKLGEDEGTVRMQFEVGGREFEVARGLVRKGSGVQQTDGKLTTPDEELSLSPREMKERILEVLEFNEAPDPKAQSMIYRYAVYTPQEEMKGILSLVPDVRLQTLRRAFRVEDYKTAAENASELGKQFRVEVAKLEGFGTGLEKLKQLLEELNAEEEGHREALRRLRGEEGEAERALAAAKAEGQKLREMELSMEGLRKERQLEERTLKELERAVAGLEKEVRGIRERAVKISVALAKRKGGRPPTRKTPAQLRDQVKEGEAEVKKLTELGGTIRSKLEDYGTIMRDGVCPVCDRPAEAHDFTQKKEAKEMERKHVAEELEKAEEGLEELRGMRERVEKYIADREVTKERREELARMKEELKEKEGALGEAEERRRGTAERLEELGEGIGELEKVSAEVEANEKKAAEAEGDLRRLREKMVRTNERLQQVDRRKSEVGIDIVAKEGAGERRDFLKENQIWLEDYFEPTVQLIEKSVMATINQEFDSMFQKWFSMLVGDPEKEVRVDEEFTPLVTQGGYEQDVRYLSGGERTSVALAYRLALNSMAQRVSAGMKSNLLILDEPTEGFSREQLGNVREVLDDVGSAQVIIVSHDKELESFADQILRVTKVRGVSTVESPQSAS